MAKDGTQKKKARNAQPAEAAEAGAPLKMVEARTRYKMIPVDDETFERFVAVCKFHSRKQGAQVKVWVDADYRKLPKITNEAA